jgi:hydrogenase-1 operon protein HyaF
MKLHEIPIVTIGPGSQPEESDGAKLEYLEMPRDMTTYAPPPSEVLEGLRSFAGAWAAMQWLQSALAAASTSAPQLADLSALSDEDRRHVNELLGEGEVSVHCADRALQARIQESILAGVWRTLLLDAEGHVTRDLLEVGAIPYLVRATVPGRVIEPSELTATAAPAGVINAPSILAELAARAETYRPGTAAHDINLTLLPMSEADLAFLDEALGRGTVEILSRSYGHCQMTSTAVRNVWWIRYYNSMGTLILNSIEVADAPLVACAAPEDLADSARRLADLLALPSARTH